MTIASIHLNSFCIYKTFRLSHVQLRMEELRSLSIFIVIVVILAMTRSTVSNWSPLIARVYGLVYTDDDSLMHAPAGSFQIDRRMDNL